jgi:zinc and cadmium transporter
MIEIWLYSLISVLIISAISLIGIILFALKSKKLEKFLILMIAFSAGALLGDVFIHIIPEISEQSFGLEAGFYILSGIILAFIVEKIIHWRHCHHPTTGSHPHHLSKMNLFGDGVHNLIDGIIIAASYLISIPLGIATTIAVMFHEIPQEIGDFGVLIYAGFTKTKAVLYNFLISLTAIIGAVITLTLGINSEQILLKLLAFAAGNFIYIATADLIPELHKEVKLSHSIPQLIFFILGILVMALLLLLEF